MIRTQWILCWSAICLVHQISSLQATKTVIRGSDVFIPCAAYTTLYQFIVPDSIMVEWSKDSLPLVDSTDINSSDNYRYRLDTEADYGLTVLVANDSDQGLYTCRASGDTVDSVTPLMSQTTEVMVTTIANMLSEESNVTLTVEEPTLPGDPIARVTRKNSINISWTESNGPVNDYIVYYRKEPASGTDSPVSGTSTGRDTTLLIENLDVFTEYQVWVVAHYRGGYRKSSMEVTYRTGPGTPTTAPQLTTVQVVTATTVLVSWTEPPATSLNGILIGYKIKVMPGSRIDTFPSTETTQRVINLRPYTNYTISVAVLNNAMDLEAVGPYSNTLHAFTLEAAPSAPHGLIPITVQETSFMMFWFEPTYLNSAKVTYNIDVRPKGAENWTRDPRTINTLFVNISHLEIYTEYEARVLARNMVGPGPFSNILIVTTDVSAPSPPVNVTVKDEGLGEARVSWMQPRTFYRNVDSYTIVYWELDQKIKMEAVEVDKLWRILTNLQGGVRYAVTVQAATKGITTPKTSSPSEQVFFTINTQDDTTEKPESTTSSNEFLSTSLPPGSSTGKIVGVVFAMMYLLALLVVGLTFIFVKMRKKDRMDFEKQDNGIPPAFAKPDELEEPAIPVSKFEAHVIANHADSDGGFATEYEDIQRVSTSYPALSSTDVAVKHKNRYTNIVAYDHTRVKLNILPNQPQSDYINASYIDGYERQKFYIAAQGPLKSTFEDFWRMIWEQHSMVIVMITKLEERGRRKCDRYWPAKGMPERYGDFEVALETKEKYASHVVRSFLLKNKHKKHGKVPERRIRQFHYTDWPDHGVPSFTLPVLAFVQKSSSVNPEDAGPMVVHCSAGVGRTGTYIVIDSMLKQMQAENKVNVFGFLKRIRTQRNYLVQTEEQYVFIHDVLIEWLKAGNTKVPAAELRQYTDRMTLPDEQGKTLLDEHFKFISTQKIRGYEFSKARHVLNRGKNRKNELLPIERNRVSISGVAGQESSDYINASFLQGYHRNREFIVTQHPLKETMVEFWRMLWECNSTTIVMLTDKEEDDNPIYWPTNKDESMTFGTMKVILCEEEHSNMSYITREFLLSCSQDEDQLTVKQYHCSYWPDSCSPLHTTFDLVYALEERSKMLAQLNKDVVGPMTVHDKYGGRQAGTVCALYTLHQEISLENSVDVYKTVKLYANKRPGMFVTKDEYYFLYRALHSGYMAEQQLRSFKVHSLRRNDSTNNKDWHQTRYLTVHPDTAGMLRQLGGDSARNNSSLDSDNWYRARSQTLASTGAGPQRTQQQRSSKFWHRRTKSEKRKPTNLSITNANALEVTPPNGSPLAPEVYNLEDTDSTAALPTDGDNSGGTPSTVPDTTALPDIHLNGLDRLQDEGKHDSSVHIDDGETIALMDQMSSDNCEDNANLMAATPGYQFAPTLKGKSLSRESLGNHSTKSEETRM